MKKLALATLIAATLAAPAHAGWDVAATIGNAASRIEGYVEREVTIMLNDFSRGVNKVVGRAWRENNIERRGEITAESIIANERKGLLTPGEADKALAKLGKKMREARKKADAAAAQSWAKRGAPTQAQRQKWDGD